VTFEGLDGSGKSTHLARAAAWLGELGIAVERTQEPGGTPLGEALRAIFLDPRWGGLEGGVEALLVFAARRQHLSERIEPALAAGRHVLCDRYTDSTLAYQGFGRGFDLALLRRLDELATGGRRPDLTLLFDLPAAAARGRVQSGLGGRGEPGAAGGTGRRGEATSRLDREDLAFYERVRAGYLELARGEPERFVVIDSEGEREVTARRVREALAGLLETIPEGR
jgi:dTMP kinase